MKITLLGTGTGLIRKERRSPSVLIETDDDRSILIDCGWGVPSALTELSFPLHSLTHLAISHRHADHISALPSLLQSQLIANIPHLPGVSRSDKLVIYGYPGIAHDLEVLCNMMIPELHLTQELEIIEYSSDPGFSDDKLRISAVAVRHVETMPAVSFCIEHSGKKVVVTGDLGWDETVIPQLMGADIAIMDASASQAEFEAQPKRSHLAPIQCGELASRAGVKHLVVTSLYDRESPEQITGAIRKHYSGNVTIPYDMQTFKL